MTPVEVPAVLTQYQFDEFARLSGDDNPIHVDPAFSAQTRFGRTVAHGMLLFSILQAEVARSIGGPIRLATQDLMFSAPTFAGDELVLRLRAPNPERVEQTITTASGAVTATGLADLGKTPSAQPPEYFDPAPFPDLEIGMTASRTRRFTPDDVASYLALVDDPNPLYRGWQPEMPPSLLGGMVSWLLGVDLPGPGTNWLKQHYRFHRPVTVPTELTTTVTVTRLRPDKGLVNLANTCTVGGDLALTGESLVLATDVAAR